MGSGRLTSTDEILRHGTEEFSDDAFFPVPLCYRHKRDLAKRVFPVMSSAGKESPFIVNCPWKET